MANIGYLECHSADNPVNFNDFIRSSGVDFNTGLPGAVRSTPCIDVVYKIDRAREEEILKRLLLNYFSAKKKSPGDIDYLIYAQSDTNKNTIDTAYGLQHALKMSNSQLFAVNQGCSGSLMAMKIANSLISDSSAKRALVLTNCFVEKDSERFLGTSIISDGLALMEITNQEGLFEIIDFTGKTDGSLNEKNFFIDGNPAKIVYTGAKLILSLLKRNSLSLDRVSRIIPQNTSEEAWNLYCDILGCPLDKVYLKNNPDGGHIGAVDTIKNLKSVLNEGNLRKGDYLVVYGMGFGTSWCAALLKVL